MLPYLAILSIVKNSLIAILNLKPSIAKYEATQKLTKIILTPSVILNLFQDLKN